MSSEYEPVLGDRAAGGADLVTVQELFRAASGPYLRLAWSWLAWALILPGAALATPRVLARFGPSGTLLTWSGAILLGGAIEMAAIRRASREEVRPAGRSPLTTWALRTQGNLSVVALALSALMLWQDLAWTLPGLWLLLLGHSFYMLGGISFRPLRVYGLLYQAGGVAALWPEGAPLPLFALTAATANLWMAYAVWRETRPGE
jgi:hypothetical protein